jgi:hypothetical protein
VVLQVLDERYWDKHRGHGERTFPSPLWFYVLVMAATLFFKCHSLGLQAQSATAREVFPTRVTQGNYQTLGEAWGWFLFLALQKTCNNEQTALCLQLTMVVDKGIVNRARMLSTPEAR